MSVAELLITLMLLEALFVAVMDDGMTKNLAEGVTADETGFAPFYWDSPHLFTKKGNRYRRCALVGSILALLTFLTLIVVEGPF